jgi:hypothetical protein
MRDNNLECVSKLLLTAQAHDEGGAVSNMLRLEEKNEASQPLSYSHEAQRDST